MFNGKTILVTGAAGGIGSCLVQMLLKAEAKVIAIDQDASGLSTLSNMTQRSPNLTIIPSNLADETSAVDALKGVEALYGLVHLAGTFDPDNFVIGDTKNVFDQSINANVRNFYSLFIAAKPALRASSNARIVLCSSVAFNRGAYFHTAYSGAKGAIVGMARSLARREAPNILVNVVAPGIIDTPMIRDLVKARGQQAIVQEIPVQRIGTAYEVSAVIRFLLSEDASYITGQVINVDGGIVSG
jgi:NAD(P)-dependent dehydrogenase (short-subunit alcohol dehydrogenase family)